MFCTKKCGSPQLRTLLVQKMSKPDKSLPQSVDVFYGQLLMVYTGEDVRFSNSSLFFFFQRLLISGAARKKHWGGAKMTSYFNDVILPVAKVPCVRGPKYFSSSPTKALEFEVAIIYTNNNLGSEAEPQFPKANGSCSAEPPTLQRFLKFFFLKNNLF